MTVDADTQRLAREAAGHLRAAMDQLNAAYEDMVSRGYIEHPRNTEGCCDGRGQVPHGFGALSYVTLCEDRECMARREAEWARMCGEDPDA
jgi:hypothetical protein